jgi:hypothetical protein
MMADQVARWQVKLIGADSVVLLKLECSACAQRTGAAARESLRRDHPAHIACAPRLRQRQSFKVFAPAVVAVAKKKSFLHPFSRLHKSLASTSQTIGVPQSSQQGNRLVANELHATKGA